MINGRKIYNHIHIYLIFILLFLIIILSFSPSFFGKNLKGFSINNKDIFPGYILFTPEYSTETLLIDRLGDVYHSWDSRYLQGMAVYLLENGDIVRSCLPFINPKFISGGITGCVEKYDWNSTLLWEFVYSNDQYCLHHDIEPMPNGNILMVGWEVKSKEEAIQKGRDPNLLPYNEFWPDHVIEVEPNGINGGNIVWEWHVWNHLIQDYDSSKDNYGNVADYPELIDINFGRLPFRGDFNHINSIDYNEEFDQILLSASAQSEIWVIDHSTTTEEAAGHTGGNSGKGGDILYRWGNPISYRAGTYQDKMLFTQHDAQWIEPNCPGEGNILVFNNGNNRPGQDYSSIDELVPPADAYGNYYLEPDTKYGPEDFLWSYETDFYANHLSGVHRIESGNSLICNGPFGRFSEVNAEKEIIWKYTNPYPNIYQNNVFKIRHYTSDYPGLINLLYQPIKPSTPNGPSSALVNEVCTYSTSSIDPQDNQVFYKFDWGDGTNSGWLGPYPSGKEIAVNHTWEIEMSYIIKVRAKDEFGYLSVWSDPLNLNIPRLKERSNYYSINLFKFFPDFKNFIFIIEFLLENH